MSKLSKQEVQSLKQVVKDKTLTFDERKAAYSSLMNSMMNPRKNFHPAVFDPMEDVDDYEVKKRNREEPPRILPTMGMFPKKILEGQMIGMYESNQDLYLMIAWLSKRVTELEDILASNDIKKK